MSWGDTRARHGRLLVEKQDKYGRKYVGQNDVIPSAGLLSGREMERELQKAADESSDVVVDADISTYGSRDTPPWESDPLRGSSRSHKQFGFSDASWLPESPELRRRGIE